MSHLISLSDDAFRAYERRARHAGLTLEQYLDQSAPYDDGFVLTPEMRLGIERGLAQADAGELLEMSVVRESLADYRSEWHASRSQ